MKTFPAQLSRFLRERGTQRNMKVLLRFFIVLIAMVVAYSVLFHYVMMWEGKRFSWITGFYWTLTVMSTLGFGDITFQTDLGKMFSILVLLSGVVFLLILLPFTLIQFFYAPWVESVAAARTPRSLSTEMQGHVILTHHDAVSAALIRKLKQFQMQYVLIVEGNEEAIQLHDAGLQVLCGYLDDPETYVAARVQHAAIVASTHDDVTNTTVAFTVRHVAPDVPVVASVSRPESSDVLRRAGVRHVIHLGEMVGKALARSMVGGDALAHTISHVDELLIAEANAQRTPLVGKTLRESNVAELGVNVIGVWDRGRFQNATPDTLVSETTILLLAGSHAQLAAYNEFFAPYNVSVKPVVILGAGRVGRAAAHALAARGIQSRIVDLLESRLHESQNAVVGDARDPQVLRQAGILDAPAVLITTHDDNLNTYLTIYCRSMRPDIQIISRATLERNTSTLHRAGADFVLSYASMGATTIFNLIRRGSIVMITEGLDLFRVPTPERLRGKSIIESHVREESGCTIVALRSDAGEMLINPGPQTMLEAGQEMIIVGSAEAEAAFMKRFATPQPKTR
ncbi:MAG: potassium channel family protein [Phycisphaerales bacterium]